MHYETRSKNRLKILFWDGSGTWVCAKRLEKGTFSWPSVAEGQGKVRFSAEQLALLLGGLDWMQTRQRSWWRRQPAEELLTPVS